MKKNTKIIYADKREAVVLDCTSDELYNWSQDNCDDPIDHWCPTNDEPTHKLIEDDGEYSLVKLVVKAEREIILVVSMPYWNIVDKKTNAFISLVEIDQDGDSRPNLKNKLDELNAVITNKGSFTKDLLEYLGQE